MNQQLPFLLDFSPKPYYLVHCYIDIFVYFCAINNVGTIVPSIFFFLLSKTFSLWGGHFSPPEQKFSLYLISILFDP